MRDLAGSFKYCMQGRFMAARTNPPSSTVQIVRGVVVVNVVGVSWQIRRGFQGFMGSRCNMQTSKPSSTSILGEGFALLLPLPLPGLSRMVVTWDPSPSLGNSFWQPTEPLLPICDSQGGRDTSVPKWGQDLQCVLAWAQLQALQ